MIKEIKTLEEVEAEQDLGDVFTIENFIELVRDGYFTDYDGEGYLHNGKNETGYYAECVVTYLEEMKAKYPYVVWYNK